jgi:DNA replication protein DnaC
MLIALRLPSFHRHWPMLAERADTEGWPAARFLAEVEIAERESRRIRRHLVESRLPGGKTLATFDFKALPSAPPPRQHQGPRRRRLDRDRRQPHRHRQQRRRQDLSALRRRPRPRRGRPPRPLHPHHRSRADAPGRPDLALKAALAKLDRFELIILDDIAYAQKDQAETSVLFELIARRYETRSLAIAANRPFSALGRIFPDQAVTVAAIDRLVHHATMLEMNVDSYRRRAAADRGAALADGAATIIADAARTGQDG